MYLHFIKERDEKGYKCDRERIGQYLYFHIGQIIRIVNETVEHDYTKEAKKQIKHHVSNLVWTLYDFAELNNIIEKTIIKERLSHDEYRMCKMMWQEGEQIRGMCLSCSLLQDPRLGEAEQIIYLNNALERILSFAYSMGISKWAILSNFIKFDDVWNEQEEKFLEWEKRKSEEENEDEEYY